MRSFKKMRSIDEVDLTKHTPLEALSYLEKVLQATREKLKELRENDWQVVVRLQTEAMGDPAVYQCTEVFDKEELVEKDPLFASVKLSKNNVYQVVPDV